MFVALQPLSSTRACLGSLSLTLAASDSRQRPPAWRMRCSGKGAGVPGRQSVDAGGRETRWGEGGDDQSNGHTVLDDPKGDTGRRGMCFRTCVLTRSRTWVVRGHNAMS